MSNNHATLSRSGRRAILLASLLLTGCATWNYQIIEPQPLARLVGQSPTHLSTADLSYRMQTYENRLVILIYNDQDQPLELLGPQSYVVDPKGATHSLRTLALPPHSHAKLILPPLRPRFETTPMINIGVSGAADPDPALAAPRSPSLAQHPHPLYFDMYEDADPFYWNWEGPQPIRLCLTFRQPDNSRFSDTFTIARIKS